MQQIQEHMVNKISTNKDTLRSQGELLDNMKKLQTDDIRKQDEHNKVVVSNINDNYKTTWDELKSLNQRLIDQAY